MLCCIIELDFIGFCFKVSFGRCMLVAQSGALCVERKMERVCHEESKFQLKLILEALFINI